MAMSEAEIVVTFAREIEWSLKKFSGANGCGIKQLLQNLRQPLPQCLIRNLNEIGDLRNGFIHYGIPVGDPADFQRRCEEALEDITLIASLYQRATPDGAGNYPEEFAKSSGEESPPSASASKQPPIASPMPLEAEVGSTNIENELARLLTIKKPDALFLKSLVRCDTALREAEREIFERLIQRWQTTPFADIVSARAVVAELHEAETYFKQKGALTADQARRLKNIRKRAACLRAKQSLKTALIATGAKDAEKHVRQARTVLQQDWKEFLPSEKVQAEQFIEVNYTRKRDTTKTTTSL